MTIRPGVATGVLFFLVLALYYPANFSPFNSLDDTLLVHQLLNQEGFSFMRHFSPGGTYDYYRPLLTLTYEIDRYVGGLQESFMHMVNVLLHACNTVLVFMIARRFARFNDQEPCLLPFLSALFFAIHPINTEAVNWIAGRTDILAGMFVFTSLFFVMLMLERRSLTFGFLAAIALLCGALCKETALFLVPGIFMLLVSRTRVDYTLWKGRWWLLAFCLVAVSAYFALRLGAFDFDRGVSHTFKAVSQIVEGKQASRQATPGGQSGFTVKAAVSTVTKVTGYYAAKHFQPVPLNFAINKIHPLFLVPGVMIAFLLPVWAFRRRLTDVFFLMSVFLGSSALLVVFTRLAWTPVAERYMYVPCGIFSVALVFGAAPLVNRLKLGKIFMVAVPLYLAFFAWITVDRNIVWMDNLTLYEDTVKKSPDFSLAKNELALALYSHNRANEADAIIQTTRVSSSQAASLNNVARLIEKKRYAEARDILVSRLANPEGHEVRILTTLVKVATEMAESEPDLKARNSHYHDVVGWLRRLEALTHDPFYWYRLGAVHLILKDRREAQRCFSEAALKLPAGSLYKGPATKLARDLSS